MGRNNDIDELIDAGLSRYSVGDLDGALVAWEQVLAIEPTNPQATSYLGYVRVNYEALQSASPKTVTTDSVSQFAMFAIDDHPQYVIGSSELDSASVVTEPIRRAPVRDSFGDDWFFEDDVALGTLQRSRTQSIDLSPASLAEMSLQFSLEDDDASGTGNAVSFESLTTEYAASAQRLSHDIADARRTDPSNAASGERMSRPPQLEVRLRSPSEMPGGQRAGQATLDPNVADESWKGTGDNPPTTATDADNSAIELALQELVPMTDDASRATDDLISSLPVPRRVAAARGTAGPPLGPQPASQPPQRLDDAPTLDPRSRQSSASLPNVVASAVPTTVAHDGGRSNSLTRDGLENGVTTADRRDHAGDADSPLSLAENSGDLLDLPGGPPVIVEDVLADTSSGDTADDDDDDYPTRQSARATTARSVSRTRTGANTNRTLAARIPRADSIDACAAQILDEIDAEGGRTDEPKDDRIRRRITALLARAADWNKADPEKAVCAVELALSEDPNSALAQKLIHRHREAITAVFQSYLGNLERKPQLERPLHELESVSITPRAAFLLSRIDGELTLDEILDVSGMPRLEAYRHLSQLFLRKILG